MLSDLLLLVDFGEVIRLTAVTLVACLLTYLYIYPVYLHPLAQVPGPRICALSGIWILYKSWNEQRNHYVDALHRQYGSIVRVGPNEIDISDSEYLTDVYVRDFDKGRFYTQFTNYGSFNTFSTPDKATHKQSRKVSARFYSKSHVCSDSVQKSVRSVISKLLEVVDEYRKEPINVFILWSDMAMDAVNAFTFGAKYYEPTLNDPFGAGKDIVMNFFVQSSSWFWTTQMPELYNWFVPKSVNVATEICYKYIDNLFAQGLKSIGDHEETLVNTLLSIQAQQTARTSENKPLFDKFRAKSECFDHVAAGHNTTATTLSFLYYALARHPETQDRLIDELKQFNGGKYLAHDDYTSQVFSEVEPLPFMNAVIDETMRIYAAIPGQEPRIVPASGMHWRGSEETPSCEIPGGTIVTMQPWSIHRDRKVFTDPMNWNPDRWMTEDPEKLKKMRKNLVPFSAGSRMCMGMHLAMSEIKLNVSSIFSRYRVTLEDGFDYDSKSYLTDTYTSVPAVGEMPIIFKPLLKEETTKAQETQ